jgi:serine/threonine protein kinase
MLNRFAGLRHDHLVRLLASWSRPRNFIREYCLLFPLARCDLDLYWEERSMSDTTIRWIAKQILGLTDALKSIHDPPSDALKPPDQRQYGRHGDLKPENILWYDSPHDPHGILVIADLGASAVNSLWSRSAVENKAIQHTPRYKPPECDLRGGKISRSYDIWTFGCILLELVCWCLEGKDGRQAFVFERFAPYPTGLQTDMFFDIKPAENRTYVVLVKEGVTKVTALHLKMLLLLIQCRELQVSIDIRDALSFFTTCFI